MYCSGQIVMIKGHNLVRKILKIDGNKVLYEGLFDKEYCNLDDIECEVTECPKCGYPVGATLKCKCDS